MSGIDHETTETMRAIGEEGGLEALAMVGAVLESNRRHADWLANTIQGGLEVDVERWKRRALRAESQLAAIRIRFEGLLYDPPTDDEIGVES
jgi:hypothetical protein